MKETKPNNGYEGLVYRYHTQYMDGKTVPNTMYSKSPGEGTRNRLEKSRHPSAVHLSVSDEDFSCGILTSIGVNTTGQESFPRIGQTSVLPENHRYT